jgi:hypothetical protein
MQQLDSRDFAGQKIAENAVCTQFMPIMFFH